MDKIMDNFGLNLAQKLSTGCPQGYPQADHSKSRFVSTTYRSYSHIHRAHLSLDFVNEKNKRRKTVGRYLGLIDMGCADGVWVPQHPSFGRRFRLINNAYHDGPVGTVAQTLAGLGNGRSQSHDADRCGIHLSATDLEMALSGRYDAEVVDKAC